MKTSIKNKICAVLAVIFMAFFALLGSLSLRRAGADTPDYNTTKIEDDLSDLDILLYPGNPFGSPEVIRFQEFCYSEKPFWAEYYGLYVYIYNPTEVPLRTDLNFNVLNMATAYNDEGKPSVYDNVRLTFCDATDNNRFYKFRVADPVDFLYLSKAYAREHNGVRRYDVAGVQLMKKDDGVVIDTEIFDSHVAKTYYFSGFAKGCDTTSEDASTLTCRYEALETIDLDVGHFNYRLKDDDENDIREEINAVYFSVPNRFFEEYGGLQKIKAEWYEYKTKPIFVTSDESAYSDLKDYIGVNIGDIFEGLKWRVIWEESTVPYVASFRHYFNKKYNTVSMSNQDLGNSYYLSDSAKTVPCIDWLFLRSNVATYDDYKLSAEEVKDYMEWYTTKFSSQEKILNKYAAGLFDDSIDEDRWGLLSNPVDKCGHIVQEIDAGDEFSLTVLGKQDFWDIFWGGAVKYKEKNIDPIIVLDTSIKTMNTATFADMYYVDGSDEFKESVFENCKAALDAGETPVLFRFAVTDYYASTARFDNKNTDGMSGQDGYVAQETVFLNFDVISLTFRDAGGADTVIGVVADPIDIINGIDPSGGLSVGGGCASLEDLWDIIVLAFVAWLVYFVVWKLVLPIFKK